MYKPQLIEEINFDDEVSSLSMSSDGSMLAIAIPGLVGVYAVERTHMAPRFVHLTSFVLSDEAEVKTAFFSADNSSLVIITRDDVRRELSVFTRDDGLMRELYCSNTAAQSVAY